MIHRLTTKWPIAFLTNSECHSQKRKEKMLLNKGGFNGRRILKPDTVAMMTTVSRLPQRNAGGEGFQLGLGFELHNAPRNPCPTFQTPPSPGGGLMGTHCIIDPEKDLIALYYINMTNSKSSLYRSFLSKAYQLFAE
jgi:CubicO group peptidase (beta-lactamase class C family)